MKTQRGGIIVNILLVIMLVAIGVLIYMLARGTGTGVGDTGGVSSPTMAQPRNPTQTTDEFSDGLAMADTSTRGTLDEFGAGISQTDVFNRDINNDGRPDRITRTRVENGTPHYYYEYKIELNNDGRYVDITPDGFRTTEGAECALQKLRFSFSPDFSITKISRKWTDSWTTPTMAVKTTYALHNGKLNVSDTHNMKSICDVSELFE